MIEQTDARFDPEGYWSQPCQDNTLPQHTELELFDQNGYNLTLLEQRFAKSNLIATQDHRENVQTLKQPWFIQTGFKREGAVLNHSMLVERKGYTGRARTQLDEWSEDFPLVNMVKAIRPKWGLDFSMDYCDRDNNVFEVLHWEYDCFDYNEAQDIKTWVEPKLQNTDWDHVAQLLLKRKDEWHHLGFFEQSSYKCRFFGIPEERFKMVAWE